ncbi:hypothetical protein ACP4OV_023738 [Aristida adscensionis]
MAALKVSWACILIILVVSSGAVSGEARRLMAEPCPACRAPVRGLPGLLETTTKIATVTDARPTVPGPSRAVGHSLSPLSNSAGAASGEARRLMTEPSPAGEACPACRAPVRGLPGLMATTTKMATTDARPTAPGHSPGIGNKIAGNTRRRL